MLSLDQHSLGTAGWKVLFGLSNERGGEPQLYRTRKIGQGNCSYFVRVSVDGRRRALRQEAFGCQTHEFVPGDDEVIKHFHVERFRSPLDRFCSCDIFG